MKSDEIKEAALKYFTIHGYEGASLSQIADEVGMSKDDLFMQVLRDAKETELSSKLDYFSEIDAQQPEKDLHGFLKLTIDLFQQNEHLKFWLRMTFFPPAHLATDVGKEVMDIELTVQAILEDKFREWLEADKIVGMNAKSVTLAFIGVVDTILIELVYGNDEQRLKDKLEACWSVFWRGISHH